MRRCPRESPPGTRTGCRRGGTRWRWTVRGVLFEHGLGNYPVVVGRRTATPVRFEHAVGDRLAAYVATHPGSSMSSTANRLVDEGLRMVDHPNIVFRDGPTGRRAGLVGGPDAWEIIRAVKSARAAEPELAEEEILA